MVVGDLCSLQCEPPMTFFQVLITKQLCAINLSIENSNGTGNKKNTGEPGDSNPDAVPRLGEASPQLPESAVLLGKGIFKP